MLHLKVKSERSNAMKRIILILVSSYCSIQANFTPQKGYFCAPVADLLIKPIQSKRSPLSVREAYANISLQPEQGNYACPRVHQGLFNEPVTILQSEGDEVQVEITNCFFDSAFYRDRQSKYWTLREWIVSNEELAAADIAEKDAFPTAISYREGYFDPSAVTLIYPWYDPVSKMSFSAGTRFVRSSNRKETHAFAVQLYNPVTKQIIETAIPKQLARTGLFDNEVDQQAAFVKTLYSWINYDDLSIPYVWGGVSFILRTDDEFELKSESKHCEECFAWVRPSIKESPITGLDCSCMILRAAQANDIPYYYKNATTVCNYLHPLTPSEKLEAGDILWTPGHVVIVGNIERNEIIESTGYHLGYGKMHVLPLHKKYKDMNSWQDLIKAYYNGQPLEVLNIDGSVRSVAALYRILKFSSVWKLQKFPKKNDDI
jgi:hypothetical protein